MRADRRSRDFATGLEVMALQWAQQHGYDEVRTYNALSNAPMLAVNTRLGFEREFAEITVVKDLP